ncbi:hypothetical protein [Thalassotalea ganghwensis]
MTKIGYLLLLLLSLFAKAEVAYQPDVLEQCLVKARAFNEFTYESDIERAYVLNHDRYFAVVFSKGAFGTIEDRSPNYKSLLFCVIDRNSKIQLLGRNLQTLWIDELPELFEFKNEFVEEKEVVFVKNESGKYAFKGQVIKETKLKREK